MFKLLIALFIAIFTQELYGTNQTEDLSAIQSPDSLPFRISIELSDFQLPSDNLNSYGLQAYVAAVYHGKWLLLAGRTNGLHGFDNDTGNFTRQQNTTVYVVDPNKKTVVFKSLTDPSANLTQAQIDTLSVTAAQAYQAGKTLYVVGGYGIDTPTGQFTTKSTLTAIDVPGLMQWVESKKSKKSASQYIRQTSHPLLQVTGGCLTQTDPHQPFLLIFGQNFNGYVTLSSNGSYTQQVRTFKIIDNGKMLYIQPGQQYSPNPSYRRRDTNIVPIMQKDSKSYTPAVVALSGVFTEDFGVWTVPVLINGDGSSFMADPSDPNTFKQGMNNYFCAPTGLFSKKTNDMYVLLFGGLSYLTVSGGSFTPDAEIPFINNVTTVKIDAQGNFQQYLMENEYPLMTSDFSNPGNTLLFGTEARFIPANNLSTFPNGVFSLDDLKSSPVLLGYIVGGIQSTVPNTNSLSDSAASPYIFSVFLERR